MPMNMVAGPEVDVYGLTGGMGTGKSTVSEALAAKSAIIIDADGIARELQHPGGAALRHMVDVLGSEILTADGELDRSAAAERMFADEDKRVAVQAGLLPLIWDEIQNRIRQTPSDRVAIVDAPLLLETMPDDLELNGIMVVDTPVDLAVERLVRYRGFTTGQARTRIAQQMSREDRLKRADHVISNAGSRAELQFGIEAAWQWVQSTRK